MDVFFSDTPAKIANLRAAVDHADVASLRNLAHYLRGSAMYVGAEKMCQLCHRIEFLETCSPDASEAVGELETEFARLQVEMNGASR